MIDTNQLEFRTLEKIIGQMSTHTGIGVDYLNEMNGIFRSLVAIANVELYPEELEIEELKLKYEEAKSRLPICLNSFITYTDYWKRNAEVFNQSNPDLKHDPDEIANIALKLGNGSKIQELSERIKRIGTNAEIDTVALRLLMYETYVLGYGIERRDDIEHLAKLKKQLNIVGAQKGIYIENL